MSKEIVLSGWVSVIPTKMFYGWVKKKWLPAEAVYISEGDDKKMGIKEILSRSEPDGQGGFARETKLSSSKSETRKFYAQGFRKVRNQYYISSRRYDAIKEEVSDWYAKVFKYVDKWLEKNGYFDLKKGSFHGGFCAEMNPDSEVVKNWGAPLAGPKNKVVQIKEKFGEIVVYFTNLNEKERIEIKQWAKLVEKKFDCRTRFC